MKRRGRYSGYETNIHSIPDFKMKYPEFKAYHFPSGPVHNSPCMDPYWRSLPIREGKVRDEWDFDLKSAEDD
ncbi:hypothetical protein MSSAC_2789 [Methanosarcina siciliae C2J]|uniref:Uncharacterized protein n=1 Tax=Methanosarcina siciliae C2J TaxID=1434118 RepID=A0A0E3PQV9_9EURY|nr:hypothetical protein [Methanosarcina siciliae]AKB37379.1 hypothetical protein MSSAC_2789 [Methanosarcina siciliae C2J]